MIRLDTRSETGRAGRNLLKALQEALAGELARAVADTADHARSRVLRQRKSLRPGSSPLADSITSHAVGLESSVRADAPHARYVEFGTRRMPPRPFLGPVVEEVRTALPQRLAAGVRAALMKGRS